MQTTAVKFTDYSLGAASSIQVAPADPTRVALGFSITDTAGILGLAAPWIDMSSLWFVEVLSSETEWFDLFTYGPLVCHDWHAQCAVPATLRVTECYMQG